MSTGCSQANVLFAENFYFKSFSFNGIVIASVKFSMHEWMYVTITTVIQAIDLRRSVIKLSNGWLINALMIKQWMPTLLNMMKYRSQNGRKWGKHCGRGRHWRHSRGGHHNGMSTQSTLRCRIYVLRNFALTHNSHTGITPSTTNYVSRQKST